MFGTKRMQIRSKCEQHAHNSRVKGWGRAWDCSGPNTVAISQLQSLFCFPPQKVLFICSWILIRRKHCIFLLHSLFFQWVSLQPLWRKIRGGEEKKARTEHFQPPALHQESQPAQLHSCQIQESETAQEPTWAGGFYLCTNNLFPILPYANNHSVPVQHDITGDVL